MTQEMFDVVATEIRTGVNRVMATGKTEKNAEAIVMMAVARRGVDVEFYSVVPAGSVKGTAS